MKALDYRTDAKIYDKSRRLKDFKNFKSTAPDSYKCNVVREDKCVEFLESFSEQYLTIHKNRKIPFLLAENEFNVKKCVCSSLRPSTLPYAALGNMHDCAAFLASYVSPEPLDSLSILPRYMFSPTSVLDSALGDCFERSTLLCSLLLGVGYDAYVVSGYAPQSIASPDNKSEPSTSMIHSKDEHSSDAGEGERREVEKAPTSSHHRPCIHSWVLVLAGNREVSENCFIEPSSGRVMGTKASPYLGVESVWNHCNYWINTHADKPVNKVRYDLNNIKHWQQVFHPPFDSQGLSSNKTEVPPSWVLPIQLDKKRFSAHKPPPTTTVTFSLPVSSGNNRNEPHSASGMKPASAVAPKASGTKNGEHQLSGGLISDLFDKDVLTHLEGVFAASKHGNNSLSAAEFKAMIAEYIPVKLVENIYRAIDVNDIGYVNYSAFTSYLIAAEAGTSLSAKTYITRLVKCGEQAEQPGLLHRDFIDCMVFVRKPCPMIISGGRDGQLQLWDPLELSLITPVQHKDNNSVYQDELYRSMDTVVRAQCSKFQTKRTGRSNKVPITSVCSLLNSGLLCVGSADGCVTIYELGNQDVCGRFHVDAVPTAIECFSTLQHTYYDADSANNNSAGSEVVTRYVSVGDSTGHVHIVSLHQEFELSTDVGMKNKNQQYFAVSVRDNYCKQLVHSGWINQMKYIAEVDSLISAGVDGAICFLDVTRQTVSKVFTAHQEGGSSIGVKSFSFSAFSKYIVSGGDRTMLFWDPFTLEVIMKIDTFRSPIVSIEVHDAYNKVFAILSNKTVSVWHNITFEVLQVVTDSALYKPTDNLSAMVFAPELGCLFTAGHKISAWRLERSTESMTRQDEEDLVAALFNSLYQQVVLVKSLGLVKIYQAETGEIVRQFRVVPLDLKTGHAKPLLVDKATGLFMPVIKHACFDKQLTRLVVTGFDLSVQLWNINDGTNQLQVQPQLYSTTLAHTYANLPRSISTVNYETVNFGEQRTHRKFVFIGNEYGNICGYQENNSVIDDVPVIFFRIGDHTKNHVEHYKADDSQTHKDSHLKHFVNYVMTAKHPHKKHHHQMVPNAPAGPTPSSNKFIRDVFDREALTSTEHSVLWMKYIENSPNLLVAYLSGTVTFWNLEKNVRTHDLSFDELGPVLEGMKLKSAEKILAEPPEALIKYVPPTKNNVDTAAANAEGGLEVFRSDANTSTVTKPVEEGAATTAEGAAAGGAVAGSKPASSLKRAATKLQTQRRVSAAFLHKARVKKEATISLPAVAEVSTVPWPPIESPRAVEEHLSGSESELAAASNITTSRGRTKSEEELRTEEVIEAAKAPAVLPPLAQGKRRDSAAAIVKSFMPNRKHAIAPKRSVAMNVSDTYGSVELDAYQSVGLLHSSHKSLVSSASSISLHDNGDPHSPTKLMKENLSVQSLTSAASEVTGSTSTAATDSQHNKPSGGNTFEGPKVIVDCVIVLVEAQVIIGACSDKYLRFWDLASHHILCSCCYYHRSEASDEHSSKHHSATAGGDLQPHRVGHHAFLQNKSGVVVGGGQRHHTHHHARNANTGSEHADSDGKQQQDKGKADSAPVDEVLRLLKASDSEDLLIGAYDNGMIRLWSVQSYSFVTLRSLANKHHNKDMHDSAAPKDNNFGYGLAISPITLLFEWSAHRSPVLSIEYLWFEEESVESSEVAEEAADEALQASKDRSSTPVEQLSKALSGLSSRGLSRPASHHLGSAAAATAETVSPKKQQLLSSSGRREKKSDMGQEILEGYIVSAGLDQRVFLWSVKGQCVGEFGSFGWDISNSNTWFKKNETLNFISGGRKSKKTQAASETADSAAFDYVDYDDSAHILTSFGRHKKHTVKELSSYVDELTKKIINKPPSYLDVSKQFSTILESHPIRVIKDGKYHP